MKNQLALFWLFVLFLGSTLSLLFKSSIQLHHLERSFQNGHDAFGRPLFPLSLNAIAQSFILILPIAFGLIFFSIVIGSMLSLGNKKSFFRIGTQTVLDVLNSLPSFLIALALSTLGFATPIVVSIASVTIVVPYLVRYFEGTLISLIHREYYKSTIALGSNVYHRMIYLIAPELWDRTKVILPYLLSRLLLLETSLTFLGVGTYSSDQTWGQLISEGREYMIESPEIMCYAAIPLIFTLGSFHLLTSDQSR
jgi:peptide/nickel transport system permease protein